MSLAIPFDLLRKKRAMMQKANVSHGKAKMETRWRKGESYPAFVFKVVVCESFVERCL
jgi:hypothetical protein